MALSEAEALALIERNKRYLLRNNSMKKMEEVGIASRTGSSDTSIENNLNSDLVIKVKEIKSATNSYLESDVVLYTKEYNRDPVTKDLLSTQTIIPSNAADLVDLSGRNNVVGALGVSSAIPQNKNSSTINSYIDVVSTYKKNLVVDEITGELVANVLTPTSLNELVDLSGRNNVVGDVIVSETISFDDVVVPYSSSDLNEALNRIPEQKNSSIINNILDFVVGSYRDGEGNQVRVRDVKDTQISVLPIIDYTEYVPPDTVEELLGIKDERQLPEVNINASQKVKDYKQEDVNNLATMAANVTGALSGTIKGTTDNPSVISSLVESTYNRMMPTPEEKTIEQMVNREESIGERQLKIFTYELIPYAFMGAGSAIGGIAKSIDATINSPDFISGAVNAVNTASSIAGVVGSAGVTVKYLSPAELAKLAITNFYTMNSGRGITIKEMSDGLFGKDFTGATNLNFGNKTNPVSEAAAFVKNTVEDAVNSIFNKPNTEKNYWTTKTENSIEKSDGSNSSSGTQDIIKLKEDGKIDYSNIDKSEYQPTMDNLEKPYQQGGNKTYNDYLKARGKEKESFKEKTFILNKPRWQKIEGLINLTNEESKFAKGRMTGEQWRFYVQNNLTTNNVERESINTDIIELINKVSTEVGDNDFYKNAVLTTKSFSDFKKANENDVKYSTSVTTMRTASKLGEEYNGRENNPTGYQVDRGSGGLENKLADLLNPYSISYIDTIAKTAGANDEFNEGYRYEKKQVIIENSYVDEERLNNTEPFNGDFGTKNIFKDGFDFQKNKNEINYINAEKRIDPKIRDNSNSDIGRIYVYVTNDATSVFSIPIQFNPTIQEGGVSAKYQATSFLARIGDLQSYINTSGLSSVTFSTKYLVIADEKNTSTYTHWFDKYNYTLISNIENAYRSLILPSFSTSKGAGGRIQFEYSRPPVIRVVLGSSGSNNLLTYPTRVGSNSEDNSYFYRNFIVTNVTVNKDMAEYPMFINTGTDNNNAGNMSIMDTFGYEVSLTLTEVTQRYMDVLPDFNEYYDVFKQDTNFNNSKSYTGESGSSITQAIRNSIMAVNNPINKSDYKMSNPRDLRKNQFDITESLKTNGDGFLTLDKSKEYVAANAKQRNISDLKAKNDIKTDPPITKFRTISNKAATTESVVEVPKNSIDGTLLDTRQNILSPENVFEPQG